MRKNIIYAVIASMASLASCQKENIVAEPQSEELIFTATIENAGTKTTINADKSDSENRGKIYWVEKDEITITDNNSHSAVYEAQSGGSTTTTFKIKSGETALGEGPYTATYGTAPSTSQSYTDYYSAEKEAKNLYMTTTSTATKNFTFTAACGLLKISLTAAAGESNKTISEIKVFGKVNSSDVIYTLTCSSAQSISSAKDFFIALPAGSYTVFKFTNSTGHICYKTATNAIEIADNKIQPVSLTGIVFDDLLPGKFSVSGTKKVKFTKGNLYWNGAFTLESSQIAYRNTRGTNNVAHFYWTKTAAASYATTYSDGTCNSTDVPFFAESNKDNWAVDGKRGLYVLTKDEWTYLLSTRGTGNSKFRTQVTVNGAQKCLVIAPDGYSGTIATSYDATAWAVAESAGLVCLRAAGYHTGNTFKSGSPTGYYWSATPYDKSYTYFLCFSTAADPATYGSRNYGRSVRLVSTYQ